MEKYKSYLYSPGRGLVFCQVGKPIIVLEGKLEVMLFTTLPSSYYNMKR